MEYDFALQPGANPNAITLAVGAGTVSGAVSVDGQGNLLIPVGGRSLVERRPLIYQQQGTKRRLVSGRYVLRGRQARTGKMLVGFALGRYDHRRGLVIDPVIDFSTYLGGNGLDHALGLAEDGSGNLYLTGYTTSTNFPTQHPYQGTLTNTEDAFVSKVSADGSTLLYSTYLGGTGTYTNTTTYGSGIGLATQNGSTYVEVAGSTNAGSVAGSSFPITANAYQATYVSGSPQQAFLTVLTADGSAPVYSTYLGGSRDNHVNALAVDSAGNAFLTGYVTVSGSGFPTKNPVQATYAGGHDAFISELDPWQSGSAGLLFSTYLGGSGDDEGNGIAVDSADTVYVTGDTTSGTGSTTLFPLVNARQTSVPNSTDTGFVSKLIAGSGGIYHLLYSTYLGGNTQDVGEAIAADSQGAAYVTGWTDSSNFPTVHAYQGSYGGNQDAFVSTLNAGGALVWSTYLGGSGADQGYGISVDGQGDAYVTGATASASFPLRNATQGTRGGGADAFVTAFAPGGQSLFFSTYLGGTLSDVGQTLLLDGSNHLSVTGRTASTNFPVTSTVTTTPVVQATAGGGDDAFLTQYGGLSLPTAPVSTTVHLHYSYDGAGRRTGLTYADGKTAGWSYDAAGYLSGATQPGGGSWTFTRLGTGELTSATAPNGGEQTWGYDNAERLDSTTWVSGSTTLFSQSVTLNAAGQPTVVADSWGTTTYSYDSAGRLHTASYPSGVSETDGYDADGNRLSISSTGGVSGTTLVTNTYDLADEPITSTTTISSSQTLTTTYTYDGNGNQILASGPISATVSTYNQQNQLIQVQGPTTDLQLVYDGQGDRLRSYEQLVPTPVIVNEVQDLVGAPGNRANTGAQPLPDGLSDLVNDGTQDYLYLQPGSGMAPAMGYTSSRDTYLAIDTLGSVRLATDPTNAVIGEAAYDAWGNIQASNGSTLLHGLQGSSPFGYAGQYYDPGPGTYAMRARTYNPATGQFESEDPQAYDPRVPVTLNPYAYAGDVPDLINDPSG